MNSLVSIVIVEDDAVIRAVLEMALQADGFTKVSSSARGDEGLDAIRRIKPDLVLLDVMLPTIDGFEVLRRLFRLQAHSGNASAFRNARYHAYGPYPE